MTLVNSCLFFFSILKEDGVMVLSDFHPLRKCIVKGSEAQKYQVQTSYFDSKLQDGDLAYKHFFDEHEQQDFPNVSIRSYTSVK